MEGRQDVSEPIDYGHIVEKLLEDRADIDRMIAWAKRKEQEQAGEASLTTPAPQPGPDGLMRFPRLANDSFFRLSVPDAIKKYLNIAKRPKTAKDITAALDAGGLTHQAKNLYQTVYPTLLRMEDAKDVVRVGKGEWGLTEWYPGARKPEPKEESEQ